MNLRLFSIKWQKIWLSFVTLVLILGVGEIGLSTYYYHNYCKECSKYSFAWVQLFAVTKQKLLDKKEDILIPKQEESQRPKLETAKLDYDLTTRLSESHFNSYHEFATHACIPCHYSDNGTKLVIPIKMMTESDLQKYLDASLNHGKMPPDEIFRKILLGKLNFLKKHLNTD